MKWAWSRQSPTRAVLLAALGLTLFSCGKVATSTAPSAPKTAENFGTVSIEPDSTTLRGSGTEDFSDSLWLSVGVRRTSHEVCYGSRGLFCYSGVLDLPPVCEASYWTPSGASLGTSEGLAVIVESTQDYVMLGTPLACRIRFPASVREAASAQGLNVFYADISLRAYQLEHCYSFLYPVGSARGEFLGKTGTFRLRVTL